MNKTTKFCRNDFTDKETRKSMYRALKKFKVSELVLKLVEYSPEYSTTVNELACLGVYTGYGHKNYFLDGTDLISYFKNMKVKTNENLANFIKNEVIEYFTKDFKKLGFSILSIYHQDLQFQPIRIIITPIAVTLMVGKKNETDKKDFYNYVFSHGSKSIGNEKLNNLLMNLLLYLYINKDRLKDGLPKNLSNCNNRYPVKNNHRLEISEGFIINENNSHSKSAHIRSGHFRLLKSERYGKNKGRLIFIKPAFVNGNIKSIK